MLGSQVKLDGYLEWQRQGYVIVDGQRVEWDPRTRVKLPTGVTDIAQIPLGYEIKVRGARTTAGTVLAGTLETKEMRVSLQRGC
jgi:hypothetical protein